MNLQTLVLNASYEVLRIVSWQKALQWMCLGKVEVIEEYDQDIRSVSFVVKAPAVVRFLRMVKPKYKGIRFNRINVYARDNWTCQYCNKKFKTEDLTIDHIIPRSQGGKSTWINCVCCCGTCNKRKADKSLKAANMVLAKEPVQPKQSDVFTITVRIKNRKIPESWKNYIDYLYWNEELQET
jgi:5-methylcytosine-specific restriction endonuclease McrA